VFSHIVYILEFSECDGSTAPSPGFNEVSRNSRSSSLSPNPSIHWRDNSPLCVLHFCVCFLLLLHFPPPMLISGDSHPSTHFFLYALRLRCGHLSRSSPTPSSSPFSKYCCSFPGRAVTARAALPVHCSDFPRLASVAVDFPSPVPTLEPPRRSWCALLVLFLIFLYFLLVKARAHWPPLIKTLSDDKNERWCLVTRLLTFPLKVHYHAPRQAGRLQVIRRFFRRFSRCTVSSNPRDNAIAKHFQRKVFSPRFLILPLQSARPLPPIPYQTRVGPNTVFAAPDRLCSDFRNLLSFPFSSYPILVLIPPLFSSLLCESMRIRAFFFLKPLIFDCLAKNPRPVTLLFRRPCLFFPLFTFGKLLAKWHHE